MNYMSDQIPLILGYNVYENLRYVPEDLNVNDLYEDEEAVSVGQYRPQTTSTPLGDAGGWMSDNRSVDFITRASDFFDEEEEDIYDVCKMNSGSYPISKRQIFFNEKIRG